MVASKISETTVVFLLGINFFRWLSVLESLNISDVLLKMSNGCTGHEGIVLELFENNACTQANFPLSQRNSSSRV